MKIKIHVTKEVLKASMYCPALSVEYVPGNKSTADSCAFAVAVREIFPSAQVHYDGIDPFGVRCQDRIYLGDGMRSYIKQFDDLAGSPHIRLLLPEKTFEIDVPDSVIEKIGLTQVEEILSKSLTLEKA